VTDIIEIKPRTEDGNVRVLVEIPRGSQNKYEYDKEAGVIAFDRALYSAVHYPTEYGFVPRTRSEDGELLDAMVMVERPTFAGCLVVVRLLGVLTIEHPDGTPEHKLLGVPVREPRFEEYRDVADVPEHLLKEIENFFDVFKELEGKDLRVRGWEGHDAAQRVLDDAMAAFEREGAK
jgi:inorganic pyrophosphatase